MINNSARMRTFKSAPRERFYEYCHGLPSMRMLPVLLTIPEEESFPDIDED